MSDTDIRNILDSDADLVAHYEDKFKDNQFINGGDSYQQQWKRDNAKTYTNAEKCGPVYSAWTTGTSDSERYSAIDALNIDGLNPPTRHDGGGVTHSSWSQMSAANEQKGINTNVSLDQYRRQLKQEARARAKEMQDPDAYGSANRRIMERELAKAEAEYQAWLADRQLDAELEAMDAQGAGFADPGRRGGAEFFMNTMAAAQATQDTLFQAACGMTLRELDDLLDSKFEDAKDSSLAEVLQSDLDSLGADAKRKSKECAKNLLTAKEDLANLINKFWEFAKRPDSGFFDGYNSDQLRGIVPKPPLKPEAEQAVNAAANFLQGVSGVPAAASPFAAENTPDPVQESFAETAARIASEQAETPGSNIPVEFGQQLPTWAAYYPGGASVVLVDSPNTYKFRWDFALIDEAARKTLKQPEWYQDLDNLSNTSEVAALPTLYASLAIAIHNVIEYEFMSLMPDKAEVDAYSNGADGSGSQLYTKAQSLLTYIDTPFHLQPPSGDSENFASVIGYAIESANKLENGMTKNFLIEAFNSLNAQLELIGGDSGAQCIKDEKDDLDRDLEKIEDALPEAAKSALNSTDAEQVAASAQAAIDGFSVDNIGFANITDKKLFKEQCFLLAFAAKIAAYKNNTLDYAIGTTPAHPSGIHKRLPYANLSEHEIPQTNFASKKDFNACLQMNGNPFGFINTLTQAANYKELLDIEHSQLSSLQPMIRLFKVVYNDNKVNERTAQFINSEKEREIEISFNSAFSKKELKDIFLDNKARSAGIGLKNFEFTYDGNNPFSYKKSIKAKLTLHAASFQEFFINRKGKFYNYEGTNPVLGGTEPYRYIDLALKTFSSYSKVDTIAQQYAKLRDKNANLSKLNFRLKAVVGWSMPTGELPGISPTKKRLLKKAIANSFVTLNLTPTVHNFNFQQDGSVTLEIDYLAYIDDFFDDRGFNIFADPTGVVGWSRELRKMQMKRLRSVCKTAEGIQDINTAYADRVQKEINQSLSSLISSLIQNKKIYYINLDYAKIQDFTASGPYKNYEDYIIKNTNGDIILSNDDKSEVTAQVIQQAMEAYQAQIDEYNRAGGSAEEPPNLGAALFAASVQSNELSFFYLSDLIDIILENIQREQEAVIKQYEDKTNKEAYTFPKAAAITAKGLSLAIEQVDDEKEKELIPIVDWNERRVELEKFARNLKRMRILLGPVELVHHKTQADGNISEFVNFGDIPISVKYFMEWISGKVLSKNEVFYPLPVFLNQLMNNLVTKFLNNNSCFYFDIKQKVRVNQCSITGFTPPEMLGHDELTNLLINNNIASKARLMKKHNYKGSPTRLNVEDAAVKHHRGLNADNTIADVDLLRPIINVSGRPNEEYINYPILSNEINYMVFFAGLVSKPSEYPVDKAKNETNGIFHYLLGRDRGLIKEINLSKTTSKGLAEVRFEQDGYDGLKQLRVVYDLDVKTYANVNTFPGTYIYVPAAGFDPAFSNAVITTTDVNGNPMPLRMEELGIGGYYMIIRSTHRFGMGEASSEISAKWVAGLASDYPIAEGEESDATAEGCEAVISTRKRQMRED